MMLEVSTEWPYLKHVKHRHGMKTPKFSGLWSIKDKDCQLYIHSWLIQALSQAEYKLSKHFTVNPLNLIQ